MSTVKYGRIINRNAIGFSKYYDALLIEYEGDTTLDKELCPNGKQIGKKSGYLLYVSNECDPSYSFEDDFHVKLTKSVSLIRYRTIEDLKDDWDIENMDVRVPVKTDVFDEYVRKETYDRLNYESSLYIDRLLELLVGPKRPHIDSDAVSRGRAASK